MQVGIPAGIKFISLITTATPMNQRIVIIVAVVVIAAAAVVVLSSLSIIPISIPGIPQLMGGRSLPSNGYVYVIGAYPNVPTIISDVVRGSPISGLKSNEGIGSLSSGAVNVILSMIRGNDSFVITHGNPNAPVWLIEFLDPVCPYCTIFDVYNFSQIMPFISSGKVYYIVIYFPTHALGYYQSYLQANATNPAAAAVLLAAFNDSVALWLQWKCIGAAKPGDVINAINYTYINNFIYLVNYVESNNQAYLVYYPIASYSLINKTYPGCQIKLTPQQALNITGSALNDVNEVIPLLIPKQLQNNVGTPMFIIMKNPMKVG